MKSQIIISSLIDEIIDEHRTARPPTLHDDWPGYRNHAQRVFVFGSALLERWHVTDARAHEKLAIAAAFHDIHVFETLDYLQLNNDSLFRWLYDRDQERWFPEIATAMSLHHQIRAYRGNHAWLVEAIRKADWVEVTMGRIRHGIPRSIIQEAHQQLPTNQFAKASGRRIALNAVTHPTNPFPFWRSHKALSHIARVAP
ncbi:hypothetical protein [Mycobacteroides chelonae]|nr:hypothetical protein [Mycobacteroides chelonae]